jgi:hypothetical protein
MLKVYNEELDKEYLERELLDTNFEITKDKITVSSPSTSYCNITRVKNEFTNKELLNLYSSVVKLAKLNKVTVSRKNGYKKFITENFEKYENNIVYYNNMFDNLIVQFREIKNRGLHMGTSDDFILDKATDLKNEYIKMYYGSSVICKMRSIYKDLLELHDDLTQVKINLIKFVI